MSPVDFDDLQIRILDASAQAYREISASLPTATIAAFALYTDSGAMTLCPAMATDEFYRRIREKEPDEFPFYQFSPSEWPFEGEGADEAFDEICTRIREHVFSTRTTRMPSTSFANACWRPR